MNHTSPCFDTLEIRRKINWVRECSTLLITTQFFACPCSLHFGSFEPKVIIDKSRGEVSLLEQDTIENVSKPIKNQKERKKNHFMQLFSEDTTMFLFINLFYQKKRPQKLLIFGQNVFFSVMPTGPNPAQSSIPVP